ncbi:hypothetical protein, partial [Caldifermentibacillus hisashii]
DLSMVFLFFTVAFNFTTNRYLFFAINRIVDEKSTAFLLHFGFYWKKGFLIKGGSYVDFLVQE